MKRVNRKFYTLLLVTWDFISVIITMLFIRSIDLDSPYIKGLTSKYIENFVPFVLICFGALLLFNVIFRCYNSVWRFASMAEASKILISVFAFSVLLFTADRILNYGMDIAILVIIAIMLFLLMLAGRMSVRMARAYKGRLSLFFSKQYMKKVIIYGAGEAGTYYLRKLRENPEDNLYPVAFVDDNKQLWKRKINGLRVDGGLEDLDEIIDRYNAEEVVISITDLKSDLVKKVLDICKDKYCAVKKYALVDDFDEDQSVADIPFSRLALKPINLEELLRRDSIKLNMSAVQNFVAGKCVVVTGGAGSIGSEICRQVLKFGASKLVVFDINENGLFDINNELLKKFDQNRFDTVLGSIRDRERLSEVFAKYQPSIVFHAAAHKHVPMMEINPREAIKNNVFGTINVAQEAIFSKCEKFILISTDKAVNPTNIMGASKRVAEMVIQMFDQISETDLAAVRFGNVLGSNGSVVPHFLKQIENGGPLTVTHPDMTRFFMTIPEAVQLVLEAGAMASGGEIFVLDMGEPVKIYDLACDLIKYSGLRPNKDIKIVFTGLRPGEKLYEELSLADEAPTKTANDKIFINKPIDRDIGDFAKTVKELQQAIHERDINIMFDMVRKLVETFKHDEEFEKN